MRNSLCRWQSQPTGEHEYDRQHECEDEDSQTDPDGERSRRRDGTPHGRRHRHDRRDRLGGGLRTCRPARREGDVEDAPIRRAHVQDRRGPFDLADLLVDRHPRVGERAVHRAAEGHAAVELPREHDRGAVADLELHRHDGRDAHADERLRHPRVRVGGRRAATLARVQHHEAQGLLVVEEGPEALGAHLVRPAALALEHDEAVLVVPIECAVPDVVEDVVDARLELVLQRREGRAGEPDELDQPGRARLRERLLEEPPLALDVELHVAVIGRVRDHDERAQRRRHLERPDALGQADVADERRLLGEREEAPDLRIGVERELPREHGEVGRVVEVQADADARRALALRLVERA